MALHSGSKTVTTAGTAERLASTPVGASSCVVQADPANTKRVAVGGVEVDETAATLKGIFLNPGESEPFPEDPYYIYADVQVNGEKVTFNWHSP